MRLGRALALLGALGAVSAPSNVLDPDRLFTQYTRQLWSLEEGLPQSSVFALLPSAAGDLWLGTGEGLVRFDGFEFEIYDSGNVPELRNNRVNRLAETADGTLWIGTQGGLVRRRGGRFEAVGPSAGLPEEVVYALAVDGQGELWVGTAHALFRRRDERFEEVKITSGREEVRALLADGERGLWIATSSGLYRRSESAVAHFGPGDGLPSESIFSLSRGGDGAIVVGTRRGAARQVGGRFTPLPESDRVGPVRAILTDRDGSLWIGGDSGLVRRRADGRDSYIGVAEGLPYETVTALAEDGEGNLWVGTDGGGLVRLSNGRFVPFGVAEGLPSEMIWTVREDRSGALWIGTDGEGVTRRDPSGALRTIGPREGLPGGAVYALFEDSRGRIWIGTEGGPAFIDGERLRSVRGDAGIAELPVFSFVEMPDGSVLAGTQGHLLRIVDEVAETFEARVGLSDFNGVAAALFRSRDDSIWIGTNGAGIRRLKSDGAVERYGREEGLGPGFLIDFFEDADGALWLTSDNGLFRLAGGRFRGLDRSHGLPSDRLFRILHDDRDRFWLPTNNRGVAVISRTQAIDVLEGRRAELDVRLLGRADGMRSTECNGGKPGGIRDSKGRIWVPTTAGLATIDPRTLDLASPPLAVRIDAVAAGGRALDPTREGRLGLGERTLEIAWTAPTFVYPERVRFRYRVDGLEGGWVETADRRLRLERLPPGRSRFVVEAAGEDGRWNDGASYGFDVVPRFRERRSFLWLTGGALAAAGLGVARTIERLRRRQLERRHRELEETVERRTRELVSANQELARHEADLVTMNRQLQDLTFLDPLTGIANRRRFTLTLDSELHRGRRFASPVALLLVDVDRFKEFNDRYGHPAGDACLCRIAALLRATIARAGDLVARHGGEEFAAVLPGAALDGARLVAENVRRLVAELAIPHAAAPAGFVTVSIGVAVDMGSGPPDAEALVAAADRALYRAKSAGRNRVEFEPNTAAG